MSQPEHNFQMDYIEFPATDIEATKRFYHQVFGWEFKDWGPGYTSFHDGRTRRRLQQRVATRGRAMAPRRAACWSSSTRLRWTTPIAR